MNRVQYWRRVQERRRRREAIEDAVAAVITVLICGVIALAAGGQL